MRDGVTQAVRAGPLECRLHGVEGHGQRRVADRVGVDREAELVGPRIDRRQGLHVEAGRSDVALRLGLGVRVGLLHVGGRGVAPDDAVHLDLYVG